MIECDKEQERELERGDGSHSVHIHCLSPKTGKRERAETATVLEME